MTKAGKDGVRGAVKGAAPAIPRAKKPTETVVPKYIARQFAMREDGLWKVGDEQAGDMWICARFVVEAETRDDSSRGWGLLLSWHDRSGIRHEEAFGRSLFGGECAEVRSRLSDAGLTFGAKLPARQAFAEYLNAVSCIKRARCVPRGGWHNVDGSSIFLLPDETFGACPERVVLQTTEREASVFNTAGSLTDWASGPGALCIGNSRLIFAVCCAFAAPLLGVVGELGGGFNLRGSSRVGKSTALRLAASVWGGTPSHGAGGYIRPFRATGNGLEAVAAMHCDTLLLLDEMGQVDSREAGEIAYLLANGQSKIRSNRGGGTARAAMHFRVLFLSTGEIGLNEKNREAGRETKAGQEVRLTDVPADAAAGMGLFEYLHDAPSASAFADEIREATASCYGTAAPVFLRRLVDAISRDADFARKIRDRSSKLVDKWLLPYGIAGGQVHSIAMRFGLVAVAGELATQWGITGWPAAEASAGVHKCFDACLVERGTLGAREDEQAVAKLRGFIAANGTARFERWVEDRPKNEADQSSGDDTPPAERFITQKRAGWRRWTRQADGRHCWVHFLTAEGMNEALSGLNFRDALSTLVERACIRPDATGRTSRSLTPPGQGKMRLYEVLPMITEIADDCLGSDRPLREYLHPAADYLYGEQP